MGAFIGTLGILGVLVSIVLIIVRALFKKGLTFKRIGILFVVSFVVFIVGIASSGSSGNNDTKDTTSKNLVSQTPPKQDTKDDAEAKAKAEADAKAKADAEAKQWSDFVAKNTKKLSAGNYTVGKQIDKGIYDVTFNGSGNFTVTSSDGSLLTNEIGGSNLGITKYRALFTDGAQIKIEGMSINVKPVKQTLATYGTIKLYSGYWIAGQDITKGRYKVKPIKGSGNFFIYDSNGYPKTNEILGGELGVSEVIIDLKDKDIINTSGIDTIQLEPTS